MNFEQAVEMAGRWPGDRTVPRRLRVAYDQAKGEERWPLGVLVEALKTAAEPIEDHELIAVYFN